MKYHDEKNPKDFPEDMTATQLSMYLESKNRRLSVTQIYRKAKRGEIPSSKPPHSKMRRFNRLEINAWLAGGNGE